MTFDNGPINLVDPDTVEQLGTLIGRIEEDPHLTVVVFRSEKPGYFMAHWDLLADPARADLPGARARGRGGCVRVRARLEPWTG